MQIILSNEKFVIYITNVSIDENFLNNGKTRKYFLFIITMEIFASLDIRTWSVVM